MAVLSRDDFFAKLHEKIGNDTSEESISFLEDMTDTFNDLEQKATGDGVDWQKRYNDLDNSWRERYRHRFFSGGSPMRQQMEAISGAEYAENNAETISINDLFK